MNIFSPHISFSELTELAEQVRTSPDAMAHLAVCSECSSQLQLIRQTIGFMRSDTAEDAPAELIQQAKSIFRRKVVKHGPSLVQVILASLTFDSLTNAPAFGLRSQANAGRQLIYSTETADIDVRVSAENEQWQIAGQLLGEDCPGGDVELEGDDFSAFAELNELCEFSFGSVPAGAYKISIRLPDQLIQTPRLELS
ncbi:MAG TPA: hypothetical protein VJ784_16935 [Pyrinomonadaceae bacterium]|jgi:hypothetical protein|nr:hypothetical protein [Pyrinomonadaceae bacterium]